MMIFRLDISTRALAEKLQRQGARFSGQVVQGPASPLPRVREIAESDLGRYRKNPAWASDSSCARKLKKLGFKKVLRSKEVRTRLEPPEPGITKARFDRALPRIAAAQKLFTDRHSKKVYRSLVEYRRALLEPGRFPGRAWSLLPNAEPELYFPNDLIPRSALRDFVDCGAFTGDTLWYLMHAEPLPEIRNYSAFEPDPRNFRTLSRNVAAMKSLLGDASIRLRKEALSDRNGLVRFSAQGDAFSRIVRDGKSKAQGVTLDSALRGQRASFIKIEAEGGEIAVLRGARATIRRWRPYLAVTVYHEAQDLWEIPLAIRKVAAGHRLVLRHHAWDSSRTVCYAIPSSKG